MWAAERQLTGENSNESAEIPGINAEYLNNHYGNLSTDSNYSLPCSHPKKSNPNIYLNTKCSISYTIIHHTATEIYVLPAWFLHLEAPAFYTHISNMLVQSLHFNLRRSNK